MVFHLSFSFHNVLPPYVLHTVMHLDTHSHFWSGRNGFRSISPCWTIGLALHKIIRFFFYPSLSLSHTSNTLQIPSSRTSNPLLQKPHVYLRHRTCHHYNKDMTGTRTTASSSSSLHQKKLSIISPHPTICLLWIVEDSPRTLQSEKKVFRSLKKRTTNAINVLRTSNAFFPLSYPKEWITSNSQISSQCKSSVPSPCCPALYFKSESCFRLDVLLNLMHW